MTDAHTAARLADMRQAIALAKQLGFTDDVLHWEQEIKKLEGSTT